MLGPRAAEDHLPICQPAGTHINDRDNTMKLGMVMVCAIGAVALSGCNTMAGAGKDIASGGQAIENASVKARHEWREATNRNEREYDAARKACAGTTGSDHDACMDRARADYSARMKEARAAHHRDEMRAETEHDRMEDRYDAARQKCESLRGADEDRCIADARALYHS